VIAQHAHVPAPGRPLRIVHVSDIHFWRYAFNPLRLMGKRLLGTTILLFGRARRFRLERVPELVDRVRSLNADHLLITGDLTTTALPDEFRAARAALSDLLVDSEWATILPGNHDRYTLWAHRSRRFERFFGAFAPQQSYPWLRRIDPETAILGLDPTRPGISASGRLPREQMLAAQHLLQSAGPIPRLMVACHYPVLVPEQFQSDYRRKPLINAGELQNWLSSIGPHLFCCGHVHAAWAFRPASLTNQLCLNPGAPLIASRTRHQLPGFLEIVLDGPSVTVTHHVWLGESWQSQEIHRADAFFTQISGHC
jgi:3',5'-cyclic AMP phosphodiesterase CpdA